MYEVLEACGAVFSSTIASRGEILPSHQGEGRVLSRDEFRVLPARLRVFALLERPDCGTEFHDPDLKDILEVPSQVVSRGYECPGEIPPEILELTEVVSNARDVVTVLLKAGKEAFRPPDGPVEHVESTGRLFFPDHSTVPGSGLAFPERCRDRPRLEIGSIQADVGGLEFSYHG